MSTDAIEALSFFFGLAITASAGAYAWGKWLKHRYDELKVERGATADAERLARIERAVEALSLEVERIGEAQRYSVKLLDEQLRGAISAGRPSPLAEEIGSKTPH
jgi:hypothetical protein